MARINTRDVIDLLELAISRLEPLDGHRGSDAAGAGRDDRAAAEVNRELLNVEHMLNKAAVLVKDEYWEFRGQTVKARK